MHDHPRAPRVRAAWDTSGAGRGISSSCESQITSAKPRGSLAPAGTSSPLHVGNLTCSSRGARGPHRAAADLGVAPEAVVGVSSFEVDVAEVAVGRMAVGAVVTEPVADDRVAPGVEQTGSGDEEVERAAGARRAAVDDWDSGRSPRRRCGRTGCPCTVSFRPPAITTAGPHRGPELLRPAPGRWGCCCRARSCPRTPSRSGCG